MNGDTVYGIPSSAYVNGILYNKEVFDKAGISETPKTIDDFLDDLRMIRQRTDAIPFYTNYSSLWTLQFWETFPFLEMTGDPDYRNNDFLYQRMQVYFLILYVIRYKTISGKIINIMQRGKLQPASEMIFIHTGYRKN